MDHETSGFARRVHDALTGPGFLVLPKVFESALVTGIRAELDAALDAETARYGAKELSEIGQLGYVADVPAMGPATRSLFATETVRDCVTAALGERARLSIAQGISLAPGQGRGQWPRRWHADLFQPRLAMPDAGFRFGVNCLVVLDDMAEANGATCVVPGSQAHVAPRSDDGSALEPLARSVSAPAGSLLLLDAGLWHAAGHNSSEHRRRVLKLLFVRGWIRPQLDYGALVAATPYPDLTDGARALLGAASVTEELEPVG
jgi:ectoine hydroxylase-related dioxygenase (phytanoyl-CoA dioxygenase family)